MALDSNPEMTPKAYMKSYNILDCIKNIGASWQELSQAILNSAWRMLCPNFVHDNLDEEDEEDLADPLA